MIRAAAIDIGTNTFRLLIADVPPAGELIPVHRERIITRLGEGFYSGGRLSAAACRRSLQALDTFSSSIRDHAARPVHAVATSVVREAVNGPEFVSAVERRTGIGVKVLSGDEEGRLSCAGVLSSVAAPDRSCILDIGGGSTELILSRNRLPPLVLSIRLGAVHLCEELLRSDPPSQQEQSDMHARIKKALDAALAADAGSPFPAPSPAASDMLIGTAGTITTLAAIDQALNQYDPRLINNYVLSRDRISSILRRLSAMQRKERMHVPGLEPGREDLIIAGSAIVLQIMDRFGFDLMTVSDGGLLEGIIIDACRRQ